MFSNKKAHRFIEQPHHIPELRRGLAKPIPAQPMPAKLIAAQLIAALPIPVQLIAAQPTLAEPMGWILNKY